MKLNDKRGFTLIEVIVVAGIIAILAGILVPMIFNQIDESKRTRATADCKSISTAVLTFKKDVGRWPNLQSGTNNFSFLYGPGYAPGGAFDAQLSAQNYTLAPSDSLNNHLNSNDPPYTAALWKGPYMTGMGLDPWGNPYVIDATGLNDNTTPVWVISAGPNGIFETLRGTQELDANKDDIGIRIK